MPFRLRQGSSPEPCRRPLELAELPEGVDDAGGEYFDVDVRLLRLHLGNNIAALHAVAGFDIPTREFPGFHVGAETRHTEFGHAGFSVIIVRIKRTIFSG